MEIFKIQLALGPGNKIIETVPAFAYNKGRKNKIMLDTDADLLFFMQGQPRKFAYCERDEDGRLVIKSEAPEQEW